MSGPAFQIHPQDSRFWMARPTLAIHPTDPAVEVAPTWKHIVKESIKDFGLEWTMINIVRQGWKHLYNENPVVLITYIEKCDSNVRDELEAVILAKCSAETAIDPPLVDIRIGRAVRLNQHTHRSPHHSTPVLNMGKMVSVEVDESSQNGKTSTIGPLIEIIRNNKVSRGTLFTHHGVSNDDEMISRSQSMYFLLHFPLTNLIILSELRVLSPCDSAIEAAISFIQSSISCYQDEVTRLRSHMKQLRIQIQQKSSMRIDTSAADKQMKTAEKEFRVAKDALREYQEQLSQQNLPKEHRHCGFVSCSSGLTQKTEQGGSRDWAVIEPIDSAWPENPNTVRNPILSISPWGNPTIIANYLQYKFPGAVSDVKVKKIISISEVRPSKQTTPIDIDDEDFEKYKVFSTGGTGGDVPIRHGMISHIKSDVRLPDSQGQRLLETSEWVVIPDSRSTKAFCNSGDSGNAVITAKLPHRVIGMIIGGSDDDKFCYISDAEMTANDIRTMTRSDCVRLA